MSKIDPNRGGLVKSIVINDCFIMILSQMAPTYLTSDQVYHNMKILKFDYALYTWTLYKIHHIKCNRGYLME